MTNVTKQYADSWTLEDYLRRKVKLEKRGDDKAIQRLNNMAWVGRLLTEHYGPVNEEEWTG